MILSLIRRTMESDRHQIEGVWRDPLTVYSGGRYSCYRVRWERQYGLYVSQKETEEGRQKDRKGEGRERSSHWAVETTITDQLIPELAVYYVQWYNLVFGARGHG